MLAHGPVRPCAGAAAGSSDPKALFAGQAAEVLLDAIARSDGTRESVVRELFATEIENGILGRFRCGENGDPALILVSIDRVAGRGERRTRSWGRRETSSIVSGRPRRSSSADSRPRAWTPPAAACSGGPPKRGIDASATSARILSMSRAVTDPRAGVLLERYRRVFGGELIPVPVERIAEDLLGLRVGESEELACSGLLVPAQRRIWVNAREAAESPGRRRFTIAHELGHWVCQVLEGRWRPLFCRDVEPAGSGYPPEEREANVFAAELLMPEPAVRDAFREDDSIEVAATRFGVSSAAMHWRLYNLGLVEERPA